MTLNRTNLIVIALSSGVFLGGACAHTPAEEHRDAVETQKEATHDIQVNNQEAQKATDEAQREAAKVAATGTRRTDEAAVEADKKTAEAQQKAREDNANVQAKANEKIRDSNTEMLGDKAEVRVWGQKKLDDLNNLIDGARVKAQKAPAQAQTSFESGMKEVQAKRDELTTELRSIETQSAQKVSDYKLRLTKEVDALEARVEKLKKAL